MSPRNLNLTAVSSVNMEYSHEESLLSVGEDFSPQPSPNPADFSDSDRDEREREEPLGFGVRPYMIASRSTAGREREGETAHACDVWSCLMDDQVSRQQHSPDSPTHTQTHTHSHPHACILPSPSLPCSATHPAPPPSSAVMIRQREKPQEGQRSDISALSRHTVNLMEAT